VKELMLQMPTMCYIETMNYYFVMIPLTPTSFWSVYAVAGPRSRTL
jgi:hypothetical protein